MGLEERALGPALPCVPEHPVPCPLAPPPRVMEQRGGRKQPLVRGHPWGSLPDSAGTPRGRGPNLCLQPPHKLPPLRFQHPQFSVHARKAQALGTRVCSCVCARVWGRGEPPGSPSEVANHSLCRKTSLRALESSFKGTSRKCPHTEPEATPPPGLPPQTNVVSNRLMERAGAGGRAAPCPHGAPVPAPGADRVPGALQATAGTPGWC